MAVVEVRHAGPAEQKGNSDKYVLLEFLIFC
jgi:hypothetical protein